MKVDEILNYSQKGYLTDWDVELETSYKVYDTGENILLEMEVASSKDGFVNYLDNETYPLEERFVEEWFEKIKENTVETENGKPKLAVNHWRCRTPEPPRSSPVNRLEINPRNEKYSPDIEDDSIYFEWQDVKAPSLAENILGFEEIIEESYRKPRWIEDSSAVSENMPRNTYNWLLERKFDKIAEELGLSPTEVLGNLNELVLEGQSVEEPDNIYILYSSGETDYDSEKMNLLKNPSLEDLASEIVDTQPDIVDITKESNNLRPKFEDYRETTQSIENTSIPYSLRSELNENVENLDEGIKEMLETDSEFNTETSGKAEIEGSTRRKARENTLLEAIRNTIPEEFIKVNNFVITREQQKKIERRLETYSQTNVI